MPFTEALETLCDAMEQPTGRALKPVANITLLFDKASGIIMAVMSTAVGYYGDGGHLSVATTEDPSDIPHWVQSIVSDFDDRYEY